MKDIEINSELSQNVARKIIEIVGGQGNPPEYGFQYFTAGLDTYLNTIEEEYLKSFIRDGGSVFKMVVGIYGGGKTHFLYNIRELAWKYDYVTSYIILSPEHTPFHKLEEVYKEIVANLVYSQTPEELLSGYDRGIEAVIKKWYNEKYHEISTKLSGEDLKKELNTYASSLGPYESTSFRNAVKEAFIALSEKRDEDFTLIIQWLKGEKPYKSMLKDFKIFEKIDKSTAFKMIRSLVQWIQEIGYSGVVVLMDEAEQTPSMSSKKKSLHLNNLRELIDECGHSNFKSTMWFYAVPDENFFEAIRGSQTYTALKQRIDTVFDAEINPTGVKIYLEKIPIEPVKLLKDIGKKLAKIYEIAYDVEFDKDALKETINNIAEAAYKKRWDIGYKRVFVQNIIKACHKLRKTGEAVKPEDIGM